MASESTFNSQDPTETASRKMDSIEALVDGLLNNPTCFEATSHVIRDLEITDPDLFRIMAEGTEGLSPTIGAGPPALPSAIQAVMNDPTVKLSKEGTGITVHDNGRLKHMCLSCGRLYDRKPRADDCRNRDLGIRPHACHGECGKENCKQSYALEELLTRHWSPKQSRFAKCSNCRIEVSKQTLRATGILAGGASHARDLNIC